jgi:hypothetical protein
MLITLLTTVTQSISWYVHYLNTIHRLLYMITIDDRAACRHYFDACSQSTTTHIFQKIYWTHRIDQQSALNCHCPIWEKKLSFIVTNSIIFNGILTRRIRRWWGILTLTTVHLIVTCWCQKFLATAACSMIFNLLPQTRVSLYMEKCVQERRTNKWEKWKQ